VDHGSWIRGTGSLIQRKRSMTFFKTHLSEAKATGTIKATGKVRFARKGKSSMPLSLNRILPSCQHAP